MTNKYTQLDKYSVLMSVYAKEKPEYLRQSIDSMLNQTVSPDQFVLVKDGPLTKELDAVVNQYIVDYPDLFDVVNLSENKGLGVALDEGLRHCRNELVARMDSDDISLSNRCERQLECFKNNPSLSIVSGYVGEFSDTPEKIESIRIVPECQKEIQRLMRVRSAFNHPAVMYKKTEVERCGGYGESIRKEDHDLFSRMMNMNCKAYNIQSVVLHYRYGKSNLKRKKSWKSISSYIKVMWDNYNKGFCGLFDFLYVCVAQLMLFILPMSISDFLIKKFYRKSGKN